MNTFHGPKTCITNLEKYLPDTHQQINPSTVAETLGNEDYLHPIDTIQISTSNRPPSICPDTRVIPLQPADTDQSPADTPIPLEPDYYDKIRVSIENMLTELPDKEVKEFVSTYTTTIGKTYYPGIKHTNKYFTTGKRVYQCIKLTQNISRHLHHFGRYLRIRYDQQPHDKLTTIDNNTNENTDKTPNRPITITARYQTPHRYQ